MHLEEVKPLNWSGTRPPAQPNNSSLRLNPVAAAALRQNLAAAPLQNPVVAAALRNLFWGPLVALSWLASGCKTSNLGADWPSQQLTVGAGPEDLVLDTFLTEPRLLISCDARRPSEPQSSGIWSLNLASSITVELPRYGEPESLVFHPHGIDLVRQPLPIDVAAPGDGALRPSQEEAVPLLYVISHDDDRDVHSVLVYQVFADHLQYLRSWTDPLLNSPNALTVLDDGTLLVTNDSGKRGNRFEALFKRKKSTVVAWNARQNRWWVAAERLAYANGIVCRGNEVYVATTRQSRIFSYRWDGEQLRDQRELARIPGADNLRWDGNDLLVAGHPSILAFVRHAGSAKKKSPVQVWRIATAPAAQPAPAALSAAPERIYANDGSAISGAATALIWSGKLYLSQVFDPFVLVVELP